MKNKIIMYMFIFSALLTIFIYVNDKRILDSKTEKISFLSEKIEELEAESVNSITESKGEYFSLSNNEDAITYFDNKNIDYKTVISKIEEQLLSKNSGKEDNPLVPYDGMEGVMRINKIKVLNHKWILADFTNGKYWGEVFYTYNVDEDGNLTITPEQSFIYPTY